MDAKLKTKWVKALRSGKYKQATNTLWNEGNDGYCCLGILCKIQGFDLTTMDDDDRITTRLPRGFNAGVPRRERHKLVSMNDDGEPFSKIADYIEKNL